GIRDFHVTGVQTCALPIYRRSRRCVRLLRKVLASADFERNGPRSRAGAREIVRLQCTLARHRGSIRASSIRSEAKPRQRETFEEIGRASCRERVEMSAVAV